jgi:hypothetical protein
MIRTGTILLLSASSLIFSARCAYDSAQDEADTEWNQTIYLLLTRPTASGALQACVKAEDQAVICANSAGTLATAYLPTLTAFYGTSITGPDGGAICNQMYSAPMFSSENPTISAGAKLCHAECNLLYWQNFSTSCTGSEYPALLTNFMNCGPGLWLQACKEPSMKECLKQCFSTGTPLWFIP